MNGSASRNRTKLVLIAGLLSGVGPVCTVNADLRIIDELGLTRAVSTASGTGDVSVRLTPEAKGDDRPVLTHVDGISPDISGNPGDEGLYLFQSVGQGTWQIKLPQSDLTISEVTIVERPVE
jgi:hypothetical protein